MTHNDKDKGPDDEKGNGHGGPDVSVIKIDRKEYRVRESVLTGARQPLPT